MTFGHGLVLLKKQAVGHVLQVGKGLALAADQAAGVVGLDIQKNAVFQAMLFNGGLEAEKFEELCRGCLWVARA